MQKQNYQATATVSGAVTTVLALRDVVATVASIEVAASAGEYFR
jgi:uncharacterized membrane protein